MRILIAAATAVTIIAVSLLVLMTPLWTRPALDLSGGSGAFVVPGRRLVELVRLLPHEYLTIEYTGRLAAHNAFIQFIAETMWCYIIHQRVIIDMTFA